MGTRIHFFVEYDRDVSAIPFSLESSIHSLSLAELSVPNDYSLFDALAGGRSHTRGIEDKPSMFFPRGLPAPVSLEVYYRYYHVVEDPAYADLQYDRLPSWILPLELVTGEVAKQWIDNGWSVLAPAENHRLGRLRRHRVSDPNWHTASWLLLAEIESSLQLHSMNEGSLSCEMMAHLSAMRTLEACIGIGRVRSVFWFSN